MCVYIYTLFTAIIHTSLSRRHGGLLLGHVSEDTEIAWGVQCYYIEHIKTYLDLWKSNIQTFHNDPWVLA